MSYLFSPALIALIQVILIDIVLAGDNAIVIGMVAANVSVFERRKVIFWGLAAAVVARIGLAVVAVELLSVLGLALAGGIVLLWVAWRLFRELREARQEKAGLETIEAAERNGSTASFSHNVLPVKHVPLGRIVFQVALADISMSLDNVLAVAGAARNHIWVLAVGLVLSIGLMGVAATYIAKLLNRYPWISYGGLLIVIYVALSMVAHGVNEIMHWS